MLARSGRAGDVAVGCTQVDEVRLRYSVRDIAQVREELLADAVSSARHKAERLAHAAERPLAAVVGVEERLGESWPGDDGVMRFASA